jgi:hypothetical protein
MMMISIATSFAAAVIMLYAEYFPQMPRLF